MNNPNSRLKAFCIHLASSATIVMLVLFVIHWLLYPDFLFDAVGAKKLFKILFFVDIVLGPILTLIVFESGKKGLKLDLTIIVACQLAAMMYGAYSLYSARPLYLTFAVDRFEVVQANQFQISKEFDTSKFTKKFLSMKLAQAKLPEDIDEKNSYMLLRMSGGAPELAHSGKYYHPIDNAKDSILERVKPLSSLYLNSSSLLALELQKLGIQQTDFQQFGILPIMASKADFIALVDIENATIKHVIRLDPWKIIE